jgi:predicted TIM-barrel fold metal-dependent hydrolase
MHPDSIRNIQRAASWLQENQDRLVIDADAHITDVAALTGRQRQRYETSKDYYHGRPISAEELICEMDLADVDMALVWQNPATTQYTADQDKNAETLLSSNRYVRDSALRYPNRLIAAGWTDPKACGHKNALRLAEIFVCEFGFPIVKMNPAQNRYAIDGPEVLAIVDRIVELGAVPAFHFGADTPFTPAVGLARVAERHPEHPVIAVHMGGGGAGYEESENLYQEARQLGLQQPNIRFVLSAKRDTHMESDFLAYERAGEPYSQNLFCGSDAPYGRIAWNFGGFRAMFKALIEGTDSGLFTYDVARRYLGGNFSRFTLAAFRRLLELHKMNHAPCR